VWDDPDRAQALGKERAALERIVTNLESVGTGLGDMGELLEMAAAEDDAATIDDVERELGAVDAKLGDLEFRRMFNGELDPNNAFLEIQAGSGGTEAQDWAEMLLRMYLKWAEQRGFTAEIIEHAPGPLRVIASRYAGDRGFTALRDSIARFADDEPPAFRWTLNKSLALLESARDGA